MWQWPFPLISLFGRYPFGWASDVFDKRHVMAVSIAFASIALILLSYIDYAYPFMIVLFVIFAGFAAAGIMPVKMPIFREYFGIRNFGKIFGIGSIFFTIGSISGPPLAGWVYDTYGAYGLIWIILSGANLIAIIFLLIMPNAGNNSAVNPRV